MRVVLGLLRPDRGRVIVAGFDAAKHWREARVRMGALVESAGFHGHWSGEKNLSSAPSACCPIVSAMRQARSSPPSTESRLVSLE